MAGLNVRFDSAGGFTVRVAECVAFSVALIATLVGEAAARLVTVKVAVVAP